MFINRKLLFVGFFAVIFIYSCVALQHGQEQTEEMPLNVMTYNIGDLNGHRPALEDITNVIKSRGFPDILLLQEVAGENQACELSDSLGMKHHIYRNNKGMSYGVAIISCYPLLNPEIYYFKASKKGYGILAADLIVKGRKVLVCSVHLDRIDPINTKADRIEMSWITALDLLKREVMEETVRSRSIEELLIWIESSQPRNVIIGGDFNTVPLSKGIRAMGRVFDDAMHSSSEYLSGTYRKSSLPIEPRIDFIFHSRDMKCSAASVIRDSAGDHYPVRALLEFSS